MERITISLLSNSITIEEGNTSQSVPITESLKSQILHILKDSEEEGREKEELEKAVELFAKAMKKKFFSKMERGKKVGKY